MRYRRLSVHRADQQVTDDHVGYRTIEFDGKLYFEHDLAFMCMTGDWPRSPVVHLNGDKSDNRWVNLRESQHERP